MRRIKATLGVAAAITICLSGIAQGAATEVNVRIEGREQTLFEGPILTEGHKVKASSDTKERSCDGIDVNDPQNTEPGATPTAASVDAMGLIGETFDGQWYSDYEDYFITRWGPGEEDLEKGWYWGVLVNNVFTNVGGCQYELSDGDEVLWTFDAFERRPFLALYPAGDTSGTRPLTATAELGKPFEVEVLDYGDDREDAPPPHPERTGSTPFEGADVSPVQTSEKGFEKLDTSSPSTVETGAGGKAVLTFDEPGWHRIKATLIGSSDEEEAIRSNRLDICVPPKGEPGCGAPPAEDEVRSPAYIQAGGEAPEGNHGEPESGHEPTSTEPESTDETPATNTTGGNTGNGGVAGFSEADLGHVRLQAPVVDGLGAAHGLIGVSWRVLEAGVGIESWTISSKTLGAGAAGYVTRASGTGATAALLELPPGCAYQLQLTITDALGRSSTTAIGKVLVPFDDRWGGLRYRGAWRRATVAGAWMGTLSSGGAGATVSATLAAGRPVFLLRASAHGARVEVRSGAHRQVFSIAGGSGGSSRALAAARRTGKGTVSLRVLHGTAELDGVAVEA